MKWLAMAWLLFVASIVVAADLGIARPVLDAVNRLPFGDKACHFLFIGSLCYLISQALANWRPQHAVTLIITTMLVVAVAATLEEVSQLWFAARTFSRADMACNYAGIVVFGSLAIWSRSTAAPET